MGFTIRHIGLKHVETFKLSLHPSLEKNGLSMKSGRLQPTVDIEMPNHWLHYIFNWTIVKYAKGRGSFSRLALVGGGELDLISCPQLILSFLLVFGVVG